MKKTSGFIIWLAVLLLAAVGFAAAADTETMKIDGFTVAVMEDSGCVIVGADESVIQDGTLTVPFQVGDYHVMGCYPSMISDSVRMVIMPQDCPIISGEDNAPEQKLEFMTLIYKEFRNLSSDELDRLPEIGKGELALTDFYRIVIARNGSVNYTRSNDDYLTTEQIPTELFGTRVYSLIDPALIMQLAGGWSYVATRRGNDGQVAVIKGYAGDEKVILTVPETLEGIPVEGIFLGAIPAETEVIYLPYSAHISWDQEETERSLIQIRYVSYEQAARENDYLTQRNPAFTEGKYLISEINRWSISGNSSRTDSLKEFYPAADLLSEIDGKELIQTYVNETLIRTEGVWDYYVRSGDDPSVGLIAYHGAPEKKMVIPDTVAGLRVASCQVTAIPEETEIIYYPYSNFSFSSNDRFGNRETVSRELVSVRYLAYEDAVKDQSSLLDRYPDFGEGSYAATEIRQMRIQRTASGSSDSRDELDMPYPAAEILTEVNGRQLVTSPITEYLGITSGEYVYTLNNKGEAYVYQAPKTDTEGLMLLPPSIDGYTVERMKAGSIPDDITAVMIPQNASLHSSSKLSHEIRLYYYFDYEMIRERGYDYEPYTSVRPGEYMLYGTCYRYGQDGSSEKLTIDYYEYPTRVNGSRIIMNINSDCIQTYTADHFTYYKLSPDSIAICAYDDNEVRKLEVPAKLDDLTVTALNSINGSFVIYASKLAELSLPSTLKAMGNRALYAGQLKALTLPDGLEEIGYYAIDAYRVKKLTLPAGLKSIGPKAMNTSAQSLTVPDSVTRIDPEAFVYMYSLKTLTLPTGLEEIPERMCQNLSRLQSVTIPERTKSIGASAFSGCKRLKTVKFAGTVLKTIGESAFIDCPISNPKLPEGLEEIGRQAFYGCTKINALVLPESLKCIGEIGFGGCKALSKVTMGAGIERIDDTAFKDCAKKMTFTAPEGSYAFEWAQRMGYGTKVAK